MVWSKDDENGVRFMRMTIYFKMKDGSKARTADYIVGDLKELFEILDKAGVNRDTTEFMYVHYQCPGTTEIMELAAWGKEVPKDSCSVAQPAKHLVPVAPAKQPVLGRTAEIIQIAEAALRKSKAPFHAKPHVKLKADASPPTVVISQSFYRASQR